MSNNSWTPGSANRSSLGTIVGMGSGVNQVVASQQKQRPLPNVLGRHAIYDVAVYLERGVKLTGTAVAHYESYDFSLLEEQNHLRQLLIRLVQLENEINEMRLYRNFHFSSWQLAQAHRVATASAIKAYNELYDEYALVARMIAPDVKYVHFPKVEFEKTKAR